MDPFSSVRFIWKQKLNISIDSSENSGWMWTRPPAVTLDKLPGPDGAKIPPGSRSRALQSYLDFAFRDVKMILLPKIWLHSNNVLWSRAEIRDNRFWLYITGLKLESFSDSWMNWNNVTNDSTLYEPVERSCLKNCANDTNTCLVKVSRVGSLRCLTQRWRSASRVKGPLQI